MARQAKSALEYLKDRYIGNDKKKLAALEQEFVNAEVARQIYDLRKRHGLNQAQLAKLIDTTQSVISRLEDADYGGHTVRMLARIAAALGEELNVSFNQTNVAVVSQREATNIENVVQLCPANEMRKRGWLPSWATIEQLREELGKFLGPAPRLSAANFRLSKNDGANKAALACWLAKLEIEAGRTDVPRFTARRLRQDLKDLAHLSAAVDGPARSVAWLEERGVRCVFIKHLPQTYLDGAAMLLDDGKPAIGLSLRHDRLDNFWFTLLHEIGHVLLHKKELLSHPIVDEEIQEPSNEEHEVQADRFANSAWVDSRTWVDFRRKNRDYPHLQNIVDFAEDLQVTPALVAGRLRHELKRWKHYSSFLEQGTVTEQIKERYPVF